jgi:hypothetical protein
MAEGVAGVGARVWCAIRIESGWVGRFGGNCGAGVGRPARRSLPIVFSPCLSVHS